MKTFTRFMALFFSVILSLNLSAQTVLDDNSISQEAPKVLVPRIPLRQIKRSGTTPVGIIQTQTNLSMEKLKTINWDANATFGIIRKVHGEVGLGGLQFNDFMVKRFVKLAGRYNYLSKAPLGLSVNVALPIYIMDGEIVKDLTIGLPVGLKNNLVSAGFLADLFKLTMRPNVDVQFSFPYWFGVQFAEQWFTKIDSSFGTIKTLKEGNKMTWRGTGFWQELLAKLSISYAINEYFDVGGNFGFRDIIKAKDTFFFGITFTMRAGSIYG